MNISSINIESRANCHDNNYALRLALKKRLRGTLKSSPQRTVPPTFCELTILVRHSTFSVSNTELSLFLALINYK